MSKRKMFSLVICMVLMVSFTSNIYVKGESLQDNETDYTEIIWDQLLEQGIVNEGDIEHASIVSMTPDNIISTYSIQDNTEMAIEIYEESGDDVEVTTIIPYKMQEDGTLMNSFEYYGMVPGGESNETFSNQVNFTDMQVHFTIGYTVYMGSDWSPYYKPTSIRAKWTGGASTTVTYMNVSYNSVGELHNYPACKQVSHDQSRYSSNSFTTVIAVQKSNPPKNTNYYGTFLQGRLPSDKVVCYKSYVDGHGSTVSMNMYYKVGSQTYNHKNGYIIHRV